MSKEDTLEIMPRDAKTGRFKKRLDILDSSQLLPPSVINVVQKSYVDLKPILESLVSQKAEYVYEDLQKSYSWVMDLADNYQAFGDGIEKLFDACEKLVSDFDLAVRNYADEFNPIHIEVNDFNKIIEPIGAYIKCIFLYLFSATVRYRQKVTNEKTISNCIVNVENYLTIFLEKLLQPRDDSTHGSIYPELIYNDNLDINKISNYIQFDSRYESELDVVKKMNQLALNVEEKTYYGSPNSSRRYVINGDFSYLGVEDKVRYNYDFSYRINMSDKLVFLLMEVQKLKNIRSELNDINWDDSDFKLIEKELFMIATS